MRAAFPHLAVFLVILSSNAFAEPQLPNVAETFDIGPHRAYVYAAPEPAEGKPWVWYAPTLKGVSLVQRKAYFESFLQNGISIAGFDLGEVRGSPESTARFHKFYETMVQRGWSNKPILLGQSRGGLMMLAWAVKHPNQLRAFVGIYPVLNLADWPMRNVNTVLADYKLSEADFRTQLPELNPINHVQSLIDNHVPVFIVHGDSDVVVPYETNTKLLEEKYKSASEPIEIKVVPGRGHEVVTEFFECPELVDFVLKYGKISE